MCRRSDRVRGVQRATFGVRKPAGWYKGRPGGYVREYSDILAIFLLKGLRPDKYRDRVEMRGALAHIDISYLPDHLLQRVADGEHIMSVLSSAVELGVAGGVDVPRLLGTGPAGEASTGEIVVDAGDGEGGERSRVEAGVEVDEPAKPSTAKTDRPSNPRRDSGP